LRPDQLAIIVPVPVEVEVYRKSKYKWDAREPKTKNSYDLDGVESAAAARSHVESMFRECLQPWAPYDQFGNPITEEVLSA
jgi:hypothetical protein